MKITYESHKLMSFFVENNCLRPIKQTKATDIFFSNFFKEILSAVEYINEQKQICKQKKQPFYNLKVTSIANVKQIPKPKTFSTDGFPDRARKTIDNYSLTSLHYVIKLYNREFNIYFILEEPDDIVQIDKYNNYVDYILYWFYIVNKHASASCTNKLSIFIYHTYLTKSLPSSNIEILDEDNVNTGFTRTCQKNGEIVVYRLEEWFKVLIHESMHNFGLDFSDMDNNICHNKIRSLFPIKSDVNLYEAYTEFWARIMNIIFCSYANASVKTDINEMLTNAEFFINFERVFAFYQMVKVLDFMDIEYRHLIEKTAYSDTLRKTFYKENTNVLSYYILALLLLNNYQDFFIWCKAHNSSMIQFKKTVDTQNSFCDFIASKYKKAEFLSSIDCSMNLLDNINKMNHSITKKGSKKKKQSLNETDYSSFLLNNLRMTICELG
jgi:hypothetical protein